MGCPARRRFVCRVSLGLGGVGLDPVIASCQFCQFEAVDLVDKNLEA